MTTGGVIITDAIEYLQGRMDHLNNQEKILKNIKEKEKEEPADYSLDDEIKTINGVF